MKLTWIYCAFAILLTGIYSSSPAYAADPKKKELCTRYAQRSVEQYNLMQSHPQCRVSDDMNWHNNLDGHYNGCMLIPEFMSRAGEAGRDNHLQACGAFAPASPAPETPGATSVGGQSAGTAAATNAGAGSAAPPLKTSAGSDMIAVGIGQPQMIAPAGFETKCQQRPPESLQRSGSSAGEGSYPQLHGDTLSFNDSRKNGTRRSFKVRRPAYFRAFTDCVKNAEFPIIGPWVWVSDNGREANFFDVSGIQIKILSIPPSVAAELLKN